jgi:hypothetical protein
MRLLIATNNGAIDRVGDGDDVRLRGARRFQEMEATRLDQGERS